jgi:DNA-binding beta-propeller fold protein YncE
MSHKLFLLLLVSACLLSGINSATAQHQLVKLWETDPVFKVPESVYYHAKKKVLYVTNIEGTDPWGKDGKGSVGKMKTDGTIIATEWVSGLNAPKGMGVYKNRLYVADLTELVVIDIDAGSIVKRITIPGATGLNDVSVGKKGEVFVSDMKEKKLFRVSGDKIETIAEGLQSPNGVLKLKKQLLVLDNGTLNTLNADKTLTALAAGMEGGTDGVEKVRKNEYIVSCWAGVIYYVHGKTGAKEVLLDTRADKKNTADIGYNAQKKIIYVPTFFRNTVVAYQLK